MIVWDTNKAIDIEKCSICWGWRWESVREALLYTGGEADSIFIGRLWMATDHFYGLFIMTQRECNTVRVGPLDSARLALLEMGWLNAASLIITAVWPW